MSTSISTTPIIKRLSYLGTFGKPMTKKVKTLLKVKRVEVIKKEEKKLLNTKTVITNLPFGKLMGEHKIYERTFRYEMKTEKTCRLEYLNGSKRKLKKLDKKKISRKYLNVINHYINLLKKHISYLYKKSKCEIGDHAYLEREDLKKLYEESIDSFDNMLEIFKLEYYPNRMNCQDYFYLLEKGYTKTHAKKYYSGEDHDERYKEDGDDAEYSERLFNSLTKYMNK